MSTTEFDTDNIIVVTEADLRDEQKQVLIFGNAIRK